MMSINFQILPGGHLPTRGSDEAAGYDLYCPEAIEFKPGMNRVFLKIKCEMPKGLVGIIHDRSSMANRGLTKLAGVIDSDYRGEWILIFFNFNPESFIVDAGSRIAQVIFLPHCNAPVVEVSDVNETKRGEGRLGSTGV